MRRQKVDADNSQRKDNARHHLRNVAQCRLTHFLVSADIKKAVDFYSRILGGNIIMDGENGKPNVVQLANTRVIINVRGGPTDDKPAVYPTPPRDGEASAAS